MQRTSQGKFVEWWSIDSFSAKRKHIPDDLLDYEVPKDQRLKEDEIKLKTQTKDESEDLKDKLKTDEKEKIY